MIPVRTGGHTNGTLMVQVFDLEDINVAQAEWRSRLPTSPVLPPDTSLVANPSFVPDGFIHGIEILNDNTTPMQFVIDVLETHLGMSLEAARETMLAIHTRGGVLIPTPSLADAQRIAAQIDAGPCQIRHGSELFFHW